MSYHYISFEYCFSISNNERSLLGVSRLLKELYIKHFPCRYG